MLLFLQVKKFSQTKGFLDMGLNIEQISHLVDTLQQYSRDFYNLTPAEIGTFIKLKSSLITKGVLLSDKDLSKPKHELVTHIFTTIQAVHKKQNEDVFTAPIEKIYAADTSLIDEDRVQIRNQIFNNNINATINHAGRIFGVQWNTRMNSCVISIPSDWQIQINQATLLDLYQKSYTKAPDNVLNQDRKNNSKLSKFMFDLLTRHSDYSIIKRIVQLEIEAHSIYLLDIDKKIHTRLKNKGYTDSTAIVLIGLYELLNQNNITLQSAITLLSYRKRLIMELEKLAKEAA